VVYIPTQFVLTAEVKTVSAPNREKKNLMKMRRLRMKCPECKGFGWIIIRRVYGIVNVDCRICEATGRVTFLRWLRYRLECGWR
jgi:hypothetical protein